MVVLSPLSAAIFLPPLRARFSASEDSGKLAANVVSAAYSYLGAALCWKVYFSSYIQHRPASVVLRVGAGFFYAAFLPTISTNQSGRGLRASELNVHLWPEAATLILKYTEIQNICFLD